jgi:FKBP-type peptidyl-prolyl cis-trans isomerase
MVCVLFAAPYLAHAQRERLPPEDVDVVEKKWPDAKVTSMSIRYVVEKAGTGRLVQAGEMVEVNYIGSLLTGKVFDKQLDPKKPFTFRVGRSQVIEGWDQILQMMRPGDKWIVIIPPELAYGRRGEPPRIPSYATLVFEMEVIGVKKDS